MMRVSADTLANPAAVNSFLSTKAVGDADQGLFIVATNSFDQVLLYYTAHASGPDVDTELIANLGTEVDLLDIQTNDFFFV